MRMRFYISTILFFAVISQSFSVQFLVQLSAAEKDKVLLDKIVQIETTIDPQNGLPWGRHGVAKGYHSNFEKGTRVHPTRAAMEYAAYFLASPLKEHWEKGNVLLSKVLELQDQNPESKTFGVWSWYAEEPLDKMAFVDYNWADFQGAVLAVILHDYSDRLTEDVREKAKKALKYCCRAIIKRNVSPGYTNIAMMGATVTAAAGEILNKPEFLDYGRQRIKRNLNHYKEIGGFNEYNSPTYTMTVIYELERMLALVSDSDCRAASTELVDYAWKMVAEHYHVPTGEWAGPHSRSYSDRLAPQTRNGILFRAGLLPENTIVDSALLVPAIPVTESLRHFFKDIPQHSVERHHVFAKDRPGFETLGVTWMDSTACLGTATFHTFWEQSRGLIGYWKVADAPSAAVLRLRFLHNGNDFSSAWGRHRQSETKIISAIGLLKNQGSMHPGFDRPKDGVFKAKSFQIVYQLDAPNAGVKIVDTNRFELTAGTIRVVVHTAEGNHFDGKPIVWKIEQKENFAAVVGICYEGEEKAFPIRDMSEMKIGLGLEILQGNEKQTDTTIKFVESNFETKEDGKFYGIVWTGLNDTNPLLAPLKPTNR
ncbi:MAG: hypothetical protein LBL62_08660 [Planctomycetaceae bacterium]|nr:hypothetical protein [Planctomycetaceae bacterium]